MITLSNYFSFEYMTASGALGFDGNGWSWEKPLKWFGLLDPSIFANVMKTVTLLPRKGNLNMAWPLGCIRPIWESGRIVGIVNAVGLSNPGIKWWAKKIGPKVSLRRVPVIGSIFGNKQELVEMAKIMDDFNLAGLEVNVSCPNTEHDISANANESIKSCEAVKTVSRFPLIVKVSVANDAERIVKNLNGIVEAISINSVPWRLIFPNKKSPLAHLGGGGVSGKVAQPHEWELIDRLRGVTNIPIIGSGVWDYADIAILREQFGVQAISFGSVFIPFPWRPTLFVRKDKQKS